MPLRLYDKDTDKLLGDISKAQLQQLIDLFEEEDLDDQDYYIDADTIEYMIEQGTDAKLVEMIRSNMGEDGIEIEWREE